MKCQLTIIHLFAGDRSHDNRRTQSCGPLLEVHSDRVGPKSFLEGELCREKASKLLRLESRWSLDLAGLEMTIFRQRYLSLWQSPERHRNALSCAGL
jgi:hypothetical protein